MRMKKQLFSVLLTCSLLLPSAAGFAAAKQITINGTVTDIPAGMGTIQERDDRTFVPIRFVSEKLGYSVSYNEVQQSVTITDPAGVSYLMMRDSELLFALPDTGTPKLYTMDTKAYIDDSEGRFYLPIRFFAQAVGYTVDWDENTQTVSLTSEK